jgi:hypothetical protein
MHDPQNAGAAAEARRLGGLRRKREGSVQLAYGFDGLAAIQDLRRLLEIAAVDTLSLDNGIPRNRTVIALVLAGAKLLEVGELADRIEKLEAAVLERKQQSESAFDTPDNTGFPSDAGAA